MWWWIVLAFVGGVVVASEVQRLLFRRGVEEAARGNWSARTFYEFWFDKKFKP